MRTAFQFFLLVALTVTQTAAAPFTARFEKGPQARTITVRLDALHGEKATISVFSLTGLLCQMHQLGGHAPTVSTLNFDGLAEGYYYIVVRSTHDRCIQALALAAGAVSLFERPDSTTAPPPARTATAAETFVSITSATDRPGLLVCLGKLDGRPLTNRLFSATRGMVFEESVTGHPIYSRVLSVQARELGLCVLYLETCEQVFVQFCSFEPRGQVTLYGALQRIERPRELHAPHSLLASNR